MQLVLVSCLIRVFTYGWNQAELCESDYYIKLNVHASETEYFKQNDTRNIEKVKYL
jgi:hypothetical protein